MSSRLNHPCDSVCILNQDVLLGKECKIGVRYAGGNDSHTESTSRDCPPVPPHHSTPRPDPAPSQPRQPPSPDKFSAPTSTACPHRPSLIHPRTLLPHTHILRHPCPPSAVCRSRHRPAPRPPYVPPRLPVALTLSHSPTTGLNRLPAAFATPSPRTIHRNTSIGKPFRF